MLQCAHSLHDSCVFHRLYSHQSTWMPDLPLPIHPWETILREEDLCAKRKGGCIWRTRSLGQRRQGTDPVPQRRVWGWRGCLLPGSDQKCRWAYDQLLQGNFRRPKWQSETNLETVHDVWKSMARELNDGHWTGPKTTFWNGDGVECLELRDILPFTLCFSEVHLDRLLLADNGVLIPSFI